MSGQDAEASGWTQKQEQSSYACMLHSPVTCDNLPRGLGAVRHSPSPCEAISTRQRVGPDRVA